jgi:erythromycin esterase-like protein
LTENPEEIGMEIRPKVTILLVCLCAMSIRAQSQNTAFLETLQKNRAAIGVRDGKLNGPGAELLRPALADAQFVALGEDHGIQQIPDFAAALCTELVPNGFHHMALEIGPYVASDLEKMARSADGMKKFAEFEKQYPETIAFYNWREEFAMLQQCEKAAAPDGITIWGVDQEFMGSAGYLLEKILATNPGPEAKARVESLLKENNEAQAAAVKTGDPGKSFLTGAKQEELDHTRELLKKQGNAEAQRLFDALAGSREIYQKNRSGNYYESNRQRALLMKENFTRLFSVAWQQAGAPPKIFFKFGGFHMFRGLNPMHSSELGNLAGEIAEAHQLKSVHILILGLKGQQSRFAGIGKPSQPAPLDLVGGKDSDFLYLKPLWENQAANSWTLYDMRALRDTFSKYGKIEAGLERIIFGYDFVVLIPDPKPSHDLE